MGKHLNKPPMPPDNGDDDDEVGYRKPPRQHRFRKGQSGNPRGRPAGAKGLKTDLNQVLAKIRTIVVNGKEITGRTQWLMLEALALRGSYGDLRAIAQLLPLILQVLGTEDRDFDANRLNPGDEAILERMINRWGLGEPALEDPDSLSLAERPKYSTGAEAHPKTRRRQPPLPESEVDRGEHSRIANKRALWRNLLRKDLEAFVEKAWTTISGGRPINWNWHIEAILNDLELVLSGECRRLLVTMPPRNGKSNLISVILPAWALGHDPTMNFVCVSYANDLSAMFGRDCLAIMQSSWYREVFPGTVISSKRSAAYDFETTRRGGRLSTSVTGTLTGRGGDIVIMDDVIKPDEVFSEVTRKKVNAWYSSTLVSRLDDKQKGAHICVMQRLHEDDLAGKLIENGNWRHLSLPAIATEDQVVSLLRGRIHHRKVGDVLHPGHEPRDVLEEIKAEMGSDTFEAQYQQNPLPAHGNLIRRAWLQYFDLLAFDPAGPGQIVQSWDTASKENLTNDFSVCVTAHIRGREIRILHVFRQRLEFPKLVYHAKRLIEEFRPSTVLIEDQSSGTHLLQTLRKDQSISIWPTARRPEGDKLSRVSGVSAMIEAGHLLLPKDAPWLLEFEKELLGFPSSKFDDQVDALAQLLVWARGEWQSASHPQIGLPIVVRSDD